MSFPSLDGRFFAGVENYDIGDFTEETVYRYHQDGNIVWATIHGGGVVFASVECSMSACAKQGSPAQESFM
jgi:hypothetical protein